MRSGDLLALALICVTGAVAVLLALGATNDWPRVPQTVASAGSSQAQIPRPFGQVAGRQSSVVSWVPVGTPETVWPRIPCALERVNDVRALRCPVRTMPPWMGEGR